MIRSLLYLDARDGDYDALVDHFRTVGILEHAGDHPGCHGSEIDIPCSKQGPMLVTALWDSPSDYDTWRDDPWRLSSSDGLRAHLRDQSDEAPSGRLYRIVHEVIKGAAHGPSGRER